MEILVKVNGQKMMIESNSITLAPGSQEFVKFIFELSEDWDGLKTFAQFSQNGVGYNIYLDSENSVYLPHELVGGECMLLLYGTGIFKIATTCGIKLYICENGYVSDSQGTEVTETLYQQLIDELGNLFDSPALTGTPTTPTPSIDTDNTQIANTAFVKDAIDESHDSTVLTGTPTAPTPSSGDDSTKIATTAFVNEAITTGINNITSETIAPAINGKADINSPVFTGTPQAPTASADTDNTQIATTEFVNDAINRSVENGLVVDAISSAIANKADIDSPTFTGTPQAPTAPIGTGNTQIATTGFVNNALNSIIVNNLTTTSEGYVLDARQGKAIIDYLNSTLGNQVVYSLDGTTLTITSK